MDCKAALLLWFSLLGLSTAEVNIKAKWKDNKGWEVTCQWQTWLNDSLQSVRMYRNDEQYAIYRPERHGMSFSEAVHSPYFYMTVKCTLASLQGQRGSCVTNLEWYSNSTEDTFKCEVSGEGPRFRLEAKERNVFVPPSNAEVNEIKTEDLDGTKRYLNCSSSGIPPPKLIWTIDGQKIPGDFTSTKFNEHTLLWHSWSILNPQKELVTAVCTPEVTTKSSIERGRPWEYDLNKGSHFGASPIMLIASMTLALLKFR